MPCPYVTAIVSILRGAAVTHKGIGIADMANQPELILAVDGGQSSTLALVAATDGRILGAGFAGPSNHVDEPGGPERLRVALTQSSREALAQVAAPHVVSICLGMTGGAEMAYTVMQAMFPQARLQSYYDCVTALAGASLAQPGVVVIAGTGAVAYGRLADGREAKAGGWGYLMGDEGSGYDIGSAALRAASQAADGRAPMTSLMKLIPAHWHLPDLSAVHRAVYAGQITRPQIARLTVPVLLAAQARDVVAQRLLTTAGEQLATAAAAVIEQLGLSATGIDVFPTGGVFQSSDFVTSAFRQALHARVPATQVKAPAFPPIVGGLLLALQAAEVELTTPVIETLRATFPQAAATKHQAREQGGS